MEQRAETIMQELLRNGRVAVDDLARKLQVSGISVRRDLHRLEKQGLLRRERGGAIPVGPLLYEALGHDSSFQEQIRRMAEEKRRIGLAAANLIEEGATVAIAAGTTTTYFARALPRSKRITVVTNSINIAMELSGRQGITVQLSGGTLRAGWFSLVGPAAVENMNRIFPEICVLSVNGIDPKRGFTDYHADEVAVNRSLIGQSRKTIVLADHTKFGVVATHAVCGLDDVSLLITDTGAADRALVPFKKKGIEVRKV